MTNNPDMDHRTRFKPAGMGAQIKTAHDVFDVADGDCLTVGQHHHIVGKPDDLFDGVTNEHNRHTRLVAQAFDKRHNLGFAIIVQ